MELNKETLRLARGGMSRAALENKSGVSAKTILRIEEGKTKGDKVRRHTIESLAKALNKKPEDLCRAPGDIDRKEAALKESGLSKVSLYLNGRARLSFGLVKRRYGIEAHRQIELAPFCISMLAEMSLAARREALDAAGKGLDEVTAKSGDHLNKVSWRAMGLFDDSLQAEAASIAARDLFGRELLADVSFRDAFDPNTDNPFICFLRKTLRELGDVPADCDDLEPDADGLPDEVRVLERDLREICDDKRMAEMALTHDHVRLADIPKELWEKGRDAERARWLEQQIPPGWLEELLSGIEDLKLDDLASMWQADPESMGRSAEGLDTVSLSDASDKGGAS